MEKSITENIHSSMHTERERETDRQTDRQTDRHREKRQIDPETETERERETETDWQAGRDLPAFPADTGMYPGTQRPISPGTRQCLSFIQDISPRRG